MTPLYDKKRKSKKDNICGLLKAAGQGTGLGFLFVFVVLKSNLSIDRSLINERFGLRGKEEISQSFGYGNRALEHVLNVDKAFWVVMTMKARKKLMKRAVFFFVVLLFYFVQMPASIIYVVVVS
jgi:hypothetical protein